MMRKARSLVTRAREVLTTEGPAALFRLSFRYFIFDLTDYYLYELPIGELNEADYLPDLGDLRVRVVRSNQEAEELKTSSGFDLRGRFANAETRLRAGAVAICVSVDGDIAHVGWVATSDEGERAISRLRQRVEFSRGEAFTGGGVTLPRYRGNRLLRYGSFARLRFLRSQGCTKLRYAVAMNNSPALKGLASLTPTVYARARHLTVLWWSRWRETPLAQTGIDYR
jgi:hypothetical protein